MNNRIKGISHKLLRLMLVFSMVFSTFSPVVAAVEEVTVLEPDVLVEAVDLTADDVLDDASFEPDGLADDVLEVALNEPLLITTDSSALSEEALHVDEVLILHWLDANAQALPHRHLALNPANNTQQTVTLRIDFSPQSFNTYEPGEIEIRLPRALFATRDGALHGGYGHRLAANHTSNTGYYYVRDGDDMIIRNFETLTGDHRLILDIAFTYTPSSVRDGFENRVAVVASFGGVEVVNDDLTLDLTTRVVPSAQVNKTHQQTFHTWQPAWGTAPANAADYFYVLYRLTVGYTSATTQPFTVTLLEDPGTDYEAAVVAWGTPNIVTHNSLNVNTTGPWTRGNTAEFNAHSLSSWTVTTPGTSVRNRHLGVIVQYRRTVETLEDTQTVINSMTATFNGIDQVEVNGEHTHRHVFERQQSVTYRLPVAPPSPVDTFSINRDSSILSNIALTLLENEHNASLFDGTGVGATGYGWVNVRGYDATHGDWEGTRPFTTTVIDDYLYLRRGAGVANEVNFLRLAPEDFTFTRVSILNFSEVIPIHNAEGVRTGTQNLTGAARSPIHIYYQLGDAPDWHLLTTFIPQAAGASPQFELPNEQVSSVKAVHANGRYRVFFGLNFWIELNSTERVRDFIDGQATVHLHSFSSLQVHGYSGALINTQAGATLPAGVSGIRERDLETFGHQVQRATTAPQLRRLARSTTLTKSVVNTTVNPTHEQDEVTYRLEAHANALPMPVASHQINVNGVDLNLLDALLPEQREGVFYDLLPRGAYIDPSSVVARDRANRAVLHTLRVHDNHDDSGRTLVEIHVFANDRNFAGWHTGFSVEFSIVYPWVNIMDHGHQLRNIAAYQSRSGDLGGTNVHADNAHAHTAFTLQERAWMSGLAHRVSGVTLPTEERNTIYTQHTHTLSQLVVTNVGFSKTARTGDTTYRSAISVLPGGMYAYRLRFQNGTMNHSGNMVMFDVLEAAHEGENYWQGVLESVDVSQPIHRFGVAPVIYYSTQSGLDPHGNPAHRDLTDAVIWTTERPDNERITAVAIDLSTLADGNPFVLAALESVVVQLHMRAPLEAAEGTRAQNSAVYQGDLLTTAGVFIERAHIESLVANVALQELAVSLSKTANPASGTREAPTVVEVGDVIEYVIRVENNSHFTVHDLILTDVLPEGMALAATGLRGYFGDDPTTAVNIASKAGITYTLTGSNTVMWRINALDAAEAFTLVIPAQIDEALTVTTRFENTATMTQLNGISSVINSETTYHIVEPMTLRDTLGALLDEVDALDGTCFTPATWGRLMSLYMSGRTLYNIPTATDAQIEQAIQLIRDAINALVSNGRCI